MDSKLILIKTISLLYLESITTKRKERSNDLAQEVVKQLRIPEQIVDTDSGRNIIVALRETLMWMIEQPSEESFDFTSLLQRVRMNSGDDPNVFQSFEDAEEYHEYTQEQRLKACRSLYAEIRSALNQWAVRDIIHQAHRELFYNRKPIDYKERVKTLVGDLENYTAGVEEDQQRLIVNLMSMSNPQSIRATLEKAKESTEGRRGLQCGWQAVNRMLGTPPRFRLGSFVLVGALTHCYKSGFVHDLFRHFCLFNDPVPRYEDKKPMLIYYSAENEEEVDITRMYVALKENETGEPVDISTIDTAEASEYISQRLTERGWEVVMKRIDPNEFTYRDLFNDVLQYEAEGFEIQAICFDYLDLINKEGCHSPVIGEDKRILMQKVRSFMSVRGILFITPHQLSQEAMSLKRAGVANFVEEVAGKNYWDGSKRIANEADLEIYLDIVEHDGRYYLGVHRGKHRTVKATPKKHRHFYLPFEEVGYIPEDINREDRSLSTLNGVNNDQAINWD